MRTLWEHSGDAVAVLWSQHGNNGNTIGRLHKILCEHHGNSLGKLSGKNYRNTMAKLW